MANGKPLIMNYTVETGELPEGMGPITEYIDYKKGGVGDVVPMICESLANEGCDVHVTLPNLKELFPRQENEEEQIAIKHNIPHGKVHLVDSEHFDTLKSPYEGDKAFQGVTAAAYQANTAKVAKTVWSSNDGKIIPIVHDWMASGYLTSYFKARNIPYLMIVHSPHTGYIDMKIFSYATGGRFDRKIGDDVKANFYLHPDNPDLINCLADGIKNAALVGIVGHSILEEFLNDKHEMDWHARNELKIKYKNNQVVVLPNTLAPRHLPENQAEILRAVGGIEFGPNSKYLLRDKRENQLAFQHATGLKVGNEYTTLFWPSRLDAFQKGINLLEDTMRGIIDNNKKVQIAIIGDDTDKGKKYENFFKYAALQSNGMVCYYNFEGNEALSDVGYSSSDGVISAPVFEPFGMFVPQGLAAGGFVMSNNTGGPKDMIKEYDINTGKGNGFLMKAHNAHEFYWTVQRTIDTIGFLKNNPERHEKEMRQRMLGTRAEFNMKLFAERYISALERVYGGPVR